MSARLSSNLVVHVWYVVLCVLETPSQGVFLLCIFLLSLHDATVLLLCGGLTCPVYKLSHGWLIYKGVLMLYLDTYCTDAAVSA